LTISNTERLLKIQRVLETGKLVSTQDFLSLLEVSRATFRRDLDYLRDRLGVPVVWDAEAGGYRLELKEGDSKTQSRHSESPIIAITGISRLSAICEMIFGHFQLMQWKA
jgi:predicted DNA-binding transcriptional regulator YafY